MQISETTKSATRFLLPTEIFLAAISLTWAAGAIFGVGPWWKTTLITGAATSWGKWTMAFALAHLLIAGAEYAIGRGWHDTFIRWSCEARYTLAWLVMSCWVVSILARVFEQAPTAVTLSMQTGIIILGNALVIWHNGRTKTILDPNIQTQRLQSRMIEARAAKKLVI